MPPRNKNKGKAQGDAKESSGAAAAPEAGKAKTESKGAVTQYSAVEKKKLQPVLDAIDARSALLRPCPARSGLRVPELTVFLDRRNWKQAHKLLAALVAKHGPHPMLQVRSRRKVALYGDRAIDIRLTDPAFA
jgi:hypothetical protein